MFKKKPNVLPQTKYPELPTYSWQIKPLAPLRSSDRRRIANQIIKDFNISLSADTTHDAASEEDRGANMGSPEVALRNSLLPENCLSAKFTTTAGPDLATVTGSIYVGVHPSEDGTRAEQRPLWVKTGDDEMFPTVYTLWKNINILPLLHTHPPVLTKIQTGADLMIPGLIGPPFPTGATKGRLVAIASSESPTVPLVVGVCEINVSGLTRVVGEKGKAVRVVHWVGDEIFNYGGTGGKIPENLEWRDEVSEAAKELRGVSLESKPEEGKGKGRGEESTEVDTGREAIRELTTKEIDEAFRAAALFGVHQYFSTGNFSGLELPLSSSQFISTLVLPFLPPASHFPPHNLLQISTHPSLIMKKTSHKNAAKFLKLLEKDSLLKTKTRNGGEVVVMEINWGHEGAKNFTAYQLPEAPKEDKTTSSSSGGVTTAANEGSMKVVELFRPNGKAMSFFSAVGAGTKDFYTASEVKSTLVKYTEKEDLVNPQNKRLIKIDPPIAAYLLDDRIREDADALRIGQAKRDLLGEKLVKSCSPYYIVLKSTESISDPGIKPKAGAPPKIQVVLDTRQGKKTVTRVSGVEPFGVDPKAMADELQRTCAGSASVAQLMGSSPKNPVMEITVQGPQKKAVEIYLEKRGVGARFVNFVDKTGKGKK